MSLMYCIFFHVTEEIMYSTMDIRLSQISRAPGALGTALLVEYHESITDTTRAWYSAA